MGFDWNFVSQGAPYITIGENGISLNKLASNIIGNPENVLIGFDKENMLIGVKPYCSKDKKSRRFETRIKHGWVRLGCKDFIKYLSSLTGIKFMPAIRYVAKYDEDSGVLYIAVKEIEEREDTKACN